jgi:hypothetical protein
LRRVLLLVELSWVMEMFWIWLFCMKTANGNKQ